MTLALIQTLKTGLSLWLHKDKTKYLNKVIKLEKAYYVEDNKVTEDKDRRDFAVLDNIDFELRLISEAFNSQVGKTNT